MQSIYRSLTTPKDLKMTKLILIITLILSLILYGYYVVTDDEVVLAPILLSLLVSFTCSMLLLAKK